MNSERFLTGKVPPDRVHRAGARIASEVIKRFTGMSDLTSTVSDVLDELGLCGAIGASKLRPTMPGAAIAGPAVTVRNVPSRSLPLDAARRYRNGMAEVEAHNQAQPGDVLVIEGLPDVSNMGGVSATLGHRQGEIGAVIDGGVRDIATQRQLGYPVWSTHVSPVTGKWRMQTVEINGTVSIQGITVQVGDLVLADDNGVCFVPADSVERVLTRCEQIHAGERERYTDAAGSIAVGDFARKRYDYMRPA